jgi:hypothetical protein
MPEKASRRARESGELHRIFYSLISRKTYQASTSTASAFMTNFAGSLI